MCLDIINHVGYEQFILDASYGTKTSRTHYFKKDDGYIYSKEDADDEKLLSSLSSRYSTTSYYTTSSSSTKDVKFEVLQYTVNRFDKFIETIKENVLAKIKAHNSEVNSMEDLVNSVEQEFAKEITF